MRRSIRFAIVTALLCCTVSSPLLPSQFAIARTVPDQSLSAAQYLGLGMAPHNREWDAVDMERASKVVTALSSQSYGKLPRYQSPRSGVYFSRITSRENLAFFKNKGLPIEERMGQLVDYLGYSNSILKVYVAGFLAHQMAGMEVIELFGSLLRIVVTVFDVTGEFQKTLDKTDSKYPVRMAGFEKMKNSLSLIVMGSLKTLQDSAYTRSERIRLCTHLQQTLPMIVPRMNPDVRQEAVTCLHEMQTDPLTRDLQPGLSVLQAKVKATLPKGK